MAVGLAEFIFPPVNNASFTPLLSSDRWMGRQIEGGVIGAHALCIISKSAGGNAAGGSVSGRQCTEVNAQNANQGNAIAGRYI